MSAPLPSVTVRVPGSTSNCGAGFDTLGLALTVYNRVTLVAGRGPGAAAGPRPETAADDRAQEMALAVSALFARATGRAPGDFLYHISGDVPAARGLGSSVTVIAGLLAGLDALHGTGLSRHDLVALTAEIEGHPDNASAGVLGGFCVSRTDPVTGAYLDTIRFEVPPEIAFVVVSPEIELKTKESRGTLPPALGYFDAVRSINSATYLVAAFASRDYGRLRQAAGDFMHEPYRLIGIPGGREAIDAGNAAGALTGWLSGSGSSVLCVCERPVAASVLAAMERAFAEATMACRGRILAADNAGLVVE
jgi:homoserine kinase